MTTERWSTTRDDGEYSSIRGSKFEIDLGRMDEKVE